MIKCYLSKLMGERRITALELHRKTGLNRKTISRLYHEKSTGIEFETLEKLCRFFNCQVSDLLKYVE